MTSATFDTLTYSKKLQEVGFPREQAEGLATKQDLKDLEYRLTLRLGGMMAASIALVAALVKQT